MNVGDRVIRVSGGPGYQGARGTVVEATPGRLRVFWDRQRKRTWVKPSVVRPEREGGAA